MRNVTLSILTAMAAMTFWMTAWASGEVILAQDAKARCVILVPPLVMEADKKPHPTKFIEAEAERQRSRLRESVVDLSHYLEKMSGAPVEILAGDLPAQDARTPILIGSRAAAVFGPPARSAPYKQGFRMVVTPKSIGLFGESDLASSYAIYELLDRLGCRWFMPSEMGEVIPDLKTIELKEIDFSSAPSTIYRGVWYADEAYKRRNRHGGLLLSAGHALEFYITKEEREQHPEWVAMVGGKPSRERLKWSNAALADVIAQKIIDRHAKDPSLSYSLSPDDGLGWDESDDKALDTGDIDETFGGVSKSDRLMVICNRIAAKVAEKDPDVLLGMLAYADYTRPPTREKVAPNIVPQLAPITYSRAHPMTDNKVPGNKQLRYMIEGWGKKSKMTSMYFYGWFLAEPSAPNPMLTKWGIDVPIVFKNNCQFWQPETLANFETSMHALYMGCRLAFDSSLKPQDVYDDINTKFYGSASKEMTAYWKYIDDVWVGNAEYSGCGYGYLRRWTPTAMIEARRLMDAALFSCTTQMEKQRVGIADDSLRLFELFMKTRHDLADGHFDTLEADGRHWMKRVVELSEQYKDQYAFTRAGWSKSTVDGGYFHQFYQKTYEDASRIAREYHILPPSSFRQFHYHSDPDRKGEAEGWAKADYDHSSWNSTDVCEQTWSTLGYHDYFKSMWYRTTIDVPAIAAGKKYWLWLGATDGSAKVFINGKLISYTDPKGKTSDEAEGYAEPFSFDITAAVKPGDEKVTIAILCTRTFFNELGTGGLLAPAALYTEADPPKRHWLSATAYAVPFETAPEGEGYFSIVEGHNNKLYVGTHANRHNSWLVELEPKRGTWATVVDTEKVVAAFEKRKMPTVDSFAAQAKIHSRNNVGESGKIYFATKQGYPNKDEAYTLYPGGYPMVYDPATHHTKVYPIAVPHQGIISITPDESHGVAYISTCSDRKPGPHESAHFMVLDLKTGKYTDLIDSEHIYAFIVVDHQHRAYHPLRGGDIARYDPQTGKLDRLKQTIDGKPPTPESHLADAEGHPINWDISKDGKTLYCIAMSTNQLFAYDLTAEGDTLRGRSLGTLVEGAKGTDCRALCVGPTGDVWAAVTETGTSVAPNLSHLVSYHPGDKSPRDRGPISIKNPDYTPFIGKDGKLLPFHGGQLTTPDGVRTTKWVTLGVCQGQDGSVYVMALQPYTVLKIPADLLK